MAGEVVADHEAAQLGRVRQRVARARTSCPRENATTIGRSSAELLDRGAEVADVVLPRVPGVGHVAAAAPAHVDDHDPPVAERVEQPLVLVGVLPHARDREHRRQRCVGAPVVERVEAHAVVVDEHRARPPRSPVRTAPRGTAAHVLAHLDALAVGIDHEEHVHAEHLDRRPRHRHAAPHQLGVCRVRVGVSIDSTRRPSPEGAGTSGMKLKCMSSTRRLPIRPPQACPAAPGKWVSASNASPSMCSSNSCSHPNTSR